MSGALGGLLDILTLFGKRASWRGVPFKVLANEDEYGRTTTLHEYPYRDRPWVEDLGQGTRRMGVVGYLVGDDVEFQRLAMQKACETAGSGTLIHPRHGARTVTLLGSARFSEKADARRVVEVSFTFIESGERLFPGTIGDTKSGVTGAADSADAAAKQDFGTGIAGALRQGGSVIQQAASTVGRFTAVATAIVGDATRAFHAVGSLVVPGMYFGRFFGGSRASTALSTLGTVTSAAAGVSALLARATAARSAVTSAVSSVTGLVARL